MVCEEKRSIVSLAITQKPSSDHEKQLASPRGLQAISNTLYLKRDALESIFFFIRIRYHYYLRVWDLFFTGLPV
jgi:hypothetical protein